MTVATTNITSGPYSGTGSGDEFSYDFRVDDKTQLSVWETNDAGVKVLLTVDTDYTVAGVGVDGGGIITRVAGNLPTDYIWYIRSNYVDTQSTAFGSQGGFSSGVHEKAFDKRTFVSQQQEDLFRRAIKLDDSDESVETADLTIPVVATRASQYLGFDVLGNLITIAGTAGAVTVSSFMETLLDDNNIETALGTLGLSKGADAASAGTLALGDGRYFDVTGTTAILAIGTKFIGAISILHFTGSLVFTHHATNLINIGGVDITTKVGDHAVMFEYDTGKSVMIDYIRADGTVDDVFEIVNNSDATKKLAFDCSDITTGNKRIMTMPDANTTFDFGTYTVVAAGGLNLDGTPANHNAQYMRIGDVVMVSSRALIIDPTAADTRTTFSLTLPITSDFSASADAGGSGSVSIGTTDVNPVHIKPDTSNDRVEFTCFPSGTSGSFVSYSYTYRII